MEFCWVKLGLLIETYTEISNKYEGFFRINKIVGNPERKRLEGRPKGTFTEKFVYSATSVCRDQGLQMSRQTSDRSLNACHVSKKKLEWRLKEDFTDKSPWIALY